VFNGVHRRSVADEQNWHFQKRALFKDLRQNFFSLLPI